MPQNVNNMKGKITDYLVSATGGKSIDMEISDIDIDYIVLKLSDSNDKSDYLDYLIKKEDIQKLINILKYLNS